MEYKGMGKTATKYMIALGLCVFTLPAWAYTGNVLNTSGSYNSVTVGSDGKYTVTPVLNPAGTAYTVTLEASALSTFMANAGRSQSCYTGSSSSGGGGGGGSDYNGVSHGVNNGVKFTSYTDSNGNTQYQAGWNNQVSSAYGPSYGNYGAVTNGGSSSSSSSSSSSGSSSGGSKSVICTHFYRRGRLPRELWRADLEFTNSQLSKTAVRGYHTWGIRSVELMRRHPWSEPFFAFLAINRAEEIGYQMGLRAKPNYKGKVIRMIMEPLCFAIGIFAKDQNWQRVHADMKAVPAKA